MIRIAAFFIVQIAVTVFALRRGGTPERIVGLVLLAATLGTFMIPFQPQRTFHAVNWIAFYIDTSLFAALLAISVRADRYWPLWLAALQLLTLGVHAVRAYDPVFLPIVYARLAGEIAYPMLALLALGTIRHHRRTLTGPEPAWSEFRW